MSSLASCSRGIRARARRRHEECCLHSCRCRFHCFRALAVLASARQVYRCVCRRLLDALSVHRHFAMSPMTASILRFPDPLAPFGSRRAPDNPVRYVANVVPFPIRPSRLCQDTRGPLELWTSLCFENLFTFAHSLVPPSDKPNIVRSGPCVEEPRSINE